jgi:acetylornithine deacetylase/succinyl-diaminopimelate desuccinylase-like protein
MLDEQKVKEIFETKIKKTFDKYLTIPNVSPAYSSTWQIDGHMEKALLLFEKWAKENGPTNSTIFIQRIENKTPLLVIDTPARGNGSSDCVLLYGHVDKQPEMTGWKEGINPWASTYIDGRVYGRGSADDGYALFCAITAINDLEDNNISHPRFLTIIEASEESGSPDLPDHLGILNATLKENKCDEIVDVTLVICLDSGALTYDHLWITNSLRGLIEIHLNIKTLNQGTHSGGAGGITPSTTHILRSLLDRVSLSPSGEVILESLNVEIPQYILDAAENTANILGSTDAHGLPFAKNVEPLYENVADQIIANTYKPALEIIGIDGIPNLVNAGNVLLPEINVALSFRIPPGVKPEIAVSDIVGELNRDTPYNAQITVKVDSLASGWAAPARTQKLSDAFEQASQKHFSNPVQYMGEGGTIPFMFMLGEKYPNAQFMVTGLLGPESNAHGPNEFLHLATFYKLTSCVSDVLHQL